VRPVKLEQAGWIRPSWGQSDSGRRVKIYELTRSGRKRLAADEAAWQHATGIVARFFKIQDEPS
jgi:DNA-binding PadR family transcriptional regulator